MFTPSPLTLSFFTRFFMHCNAGNGFKLQILWTDVRWLSIDLRLAESRWVARSSEANLKNCFIEIRRSLNVKEMY
jgi:hypothetical protein